ncbi:hypothetical protein [Flaviflexus massiliensis]|uniref:hypothetical protein n=1 Tax=Flaviflexus massiliensis TaxID=1522309 RepID=UPI0011CCBD9C|nr:hypothetical protein [Flaviflexus massiliensis]
MTSYKQAASLVCLLLLLTACGSVSNDEGTTPSEPKTTVSEGTETTTEPDLLTSKTADAEHTVEVQVPSGWYEAEKEGFDYQYLWEGNNWDDILAQDFTNTDFEFSGEFFSQLLENNLPSAETITVRDDSAELGGYPAIIVDVTYSTDSYTSLTYVDVDGHLWEFTVNAQTQEGIERGEAINATATFTP